jgi:hypothetical protein
MFGPYSSRSRPTPFAVLISGTALGQQILSSGDGTFNSVCDLHRSQIAIRPTIRCMALFGRMLNNVTCPLSQLLQVRGWTLKPSTGLLAERGLSCRRLCFLSFPTRQPPRG